MLHKDEWLSRYFTGGAYVLKSPFGSECFPAGFITAKIPSEDIETIQKLCASGFYVVETLVQFEQTAPVSSKSNDLIIRLARPDDRDAVVGIARDAFTASRLYQDAAIPKETAGQIKADWVANYFAGARGDRMIIAEQAGRVVGFVLMIGAVIDLIAVDPAFLNKGVARSMISFANEAVGLLKAGTQIINKPSIALYQSCHFGMRGAHYVLHRHGT